MSLRVDKKKSNKGQKPSKESVTSKKQSAVPTQEEDEDEILEESDIEEVNEEEIELGVDDSEKKTFAELGLSSALCAAIKGMNWDEPTDIQRLVIGPALEGHDIIGLAETGSGKTGAFALPILHFLLQAPSRFFALVLTPTRELAFQINQVFEALGAAMALHTVCITGGIDMVDQAIALAKKPHIIIATPGRLLDHLHNTKGFSLKNLKFLVMDEADRMLSMDFEKEINELITLLPYERKSYLFSATMTSKVEKLQKASLKNPVKIEANVKFQTPKNLIQQYLFLPAKWKDCYLTYLVNEFKGQSMIIFVGTCNNALRTTLMLRNLGFSASCLHGQLSQPKRLGALNKFKSGQATILIATDVASRGLDIPNVDVVINFDIPSNAKDYIHRVGRTARAGRAGRSLSFVTQYDVEAFQRLETILGFKLSEYPSDEETVLILLERVSDATRLATKELKEINDKTKKRSKKKNQSGKENDRDAEGGDEDMYVDDRKKQKRH